jgi:imidazolonepropionase-like amidohydrolase
MIRSPWLIALPACLALTFAVVISPSSFAQSDAVAFVNARIIDGTGRPPIEGGTLVVSNGRITAVGPAAVVPPGIRRIDAAGKTIVPGFVNAHGHLNVARNETMPVRDDLIRRLKTYALYGITTVVSLGSSETDELEGIRLMQEQDRTGLDRSRLYTAGQIVEASSPADARASVARLAAIKANTVKFRINGSADDMDEATWSAIIDESRKQRLPTAVHIFYLKDAQATVDKGVNVIAHSVRDQDVTPALLASMKQRNVGYIPTLTRDLSVFVYETTPDFFTDPFFLRGSALYGPQVRALTAPDYQARVRQNPQTAAMKKALAQGERNLKLVSDAGITVAMGTDSGANGGGGRWQGYFEQVEMEMMRKAGMTPMQVIVAATSNAARIFGLTQVGTLETGKWADLVVLNANPLDDIRNTRTIDSVWIAGTLQSR